MERMEMFPKLVEEVRRLEKKDRGMNINENVIMCVV